MSEVQVFFDPWQGSGDRPEVVRVTVAGEDDERFLDLLRHSVDVSSGALLVIPDTDPEPEHEWRAFAFIEPETTLGDVCKFAEGETVSISVQPLGGSFIMSLLEWIGWGLTVRELASWSLSQIHAHGYRQERAAAQSWLLSGSTQELPLEVLQAVKADREWSLTKARAVFGLDDGDLGRLFRAANYGYQPESGWIERGEDGTTGADDYR